MASLSPQPPALDRLAVHTITTKPWPFSVAADRYAEAGIRGISIWVEAIAGMSFSQVNQVIQATGLRVPALVRGGFFCDPDPQERIRRIENNRRLVELAGNISAEMLVLVVGASPSEPLQLQREWVREGIESLLDAAAAANVRLAIEPLHPMYSADKSCINRLKEARVMCESIDHPQLGVAVDAYHVWWDSDLEDEIRALGKLNALFAFHLCDWRVPTRDLLNDRALMGDGCIDLKALRGLMEANGFTGWHEVEIFSEEHWSRDQQLFLNDIVERYGSHC